MKDIRKGILILSCILLVLVGALVGVLIYTKGSNTEQPVQPTPTYDDKDSSIETSESEETDEDTEYEESDPILDNAQEYEYNSKDMEDDVKNMNLTLPTELDSSLREVVDDDELLGVTYILNKSAEDAQVEMDAISFTDYFESEGEMILSVDIGYTGTWIHIKNEDDNIKIYLGPVLAD